MHPARLLGLILISLIAAGCETIPWSRPKADAELSSGALPAVLLGERIVVARQRSRLLKAAAGPNRTIHVLLWTQPADELRYTVVRAGKLLDRDVPPAVLKSDEVLDAVVDRHGKLLAIVGMQPFELSPDGWREIAGPGCRRLVPGGMCQRL